MLKRRDFMKIGTFLGLSSYMHAEDSSAFVKRFNKVKTVIAKVQLHMFPSDSLVPSSIQTESITFLYETIMHPSYDKDIRLFVVEGAEALASREKQALLTLSDKDLESSLRTYEATHYGRAWLSRIMTLTMEGMFCDSVYGSNKKEIGWRMLDAYGGYPRAKGRYLENV